MKWEYVMLLVNDVQQMNKLGADGWELVSAHPQAQGLIWCVFKRAIDDAGKTRKRA